MANPRLIHRVLQKDQFRISLKLNRHFWMILDQMAAENGKRVNTMVSEFRAEWASAQLGCGFTAFVQEQALVYIRHKAEGLSRAA